MDWNKAKMLENKEKPSANTGFTQVASTLLPRLIATCAKPETVSGHCKKTTLKNVTNKTDDLKWK